MSIEVRAYESFEYLHLGLISELKRKSLPAITSLVGLENAQGLHHLISQSPWQGKDLEKRRLKIILAILEGREIIVMIDERDKKKGKKTDKVILSDIGHTFC